MTESEATAADVADDFNWRHYGVPSPQFGIDDEPCPRRQCRGRVPHSWLIHWFGWVRR
jgi:hypothetical protein